MSKLEYMHTIDNDDMFGAFSLDITNKHDFDDIVKVGKALSSPVRLEILHLLQTKIMNYSELGRLLDLPVGTIAFHVQILIDAGIITLGTYPEHKGHVRWCSYKYPAVLVKLRPTQKNTRVRTESYEIGVGDYTLFEPVDNWGLADEFGKIISDENSDFLYPKDRDRAQIVWCSGGKVAYPIPPRLLTSRRVKEIRISLEISSCALGYSQHYLSDITYSLGGTELCTDVSQGDFGDRYGLLTPATWFKESSKYGVLKTISVRDSGVYINEVSVNKNVTVSDFADVPQALFFSVENKANSEHIGGFNIFGEKFGDYPQAIKFDVFYCDE